MPLRVEAPRRIGPRPPKRFAARFSNRGIHPAEKACTISDGDDFQESSEETVGEFTANDASSTNSAARARLMQEHLRAFLALTLVCSRFVAWLVWSQRRSSIRMSLCCPTRIAEKGLRSGRSSLPYLAKVHALAADVTQYTLRRRPAI